MIIFYELSLILRIILSLIKMMLILHQLDQWSFIDKDLHDMQQYDVFQQNIQCQEHEKKIILLCLESDCDSNRVLCQKCLQSHANHSDQLVDLDDLQMINDMRLQKITQGKEKLQELLEQTKEHFPMTFQQFQDELQEKEKPQNIQEASLDELQEIVQKNLQQKTDAKPKPQATRLPPKVEKQCCIKKLGKRVKKDKWLIGFVVFAIILQLTIQKLCTVNTNPQQFRSYQEQNHIVVTSDTLAKPFTFDPIIQNSCKIKITPKNSMFLLGLYQGTQVENFDSRLVYTIHQEQTNEEINRKWTGSQSTYHQQQQYDSYGRKINGSYSVIKQEDIYIPTTRNQKIQKVIFNHKIFLQAGVNYVLSIESSKGYKEQFYGFELNSQNRVIETTCTMVNQLLIDAA
ncbi:hypothetical protein pb186bvf_011905 [Paramecium bursaria]